MGQYIPFVYYSEFYRDTKNKCKRLKNLQKFDQKFYKKIVILKTGKEKGEKLTL